MKRHVRLMLSCACALLAALSFYAYGAQIQKEARMERSEALERYGGELTFVVVPTRTLEVGEQVTLADVELTEWPVDLVPADAFEALDDVLGYSLSVSAAKGIPLTALNFRLGNTTAEVPSGRVAVSLVLNDKLGVSRDVSPGATLVAYATTTHGTHLVAANLLVVSVPETSSALSTQTSITLAAFPEDVPALLSYSSSGELRLVLPADDVVELSEGNQNILLDRAGQDAREAASQEQVEEQQTADGQLSSEADEQTVPETDADASEDSADAQDSTSDELEQEVA